MWGPAIPEPLWIGFALRIAQCECGEHFRRPPFWKRWRLGTPTTAREVYRQHWRDVHELDHFGRSDVQAPL